MTGEPKGNAPGNRSALSCSNVIRAYNEETHLGRLLSGIARQNLKDVEVILVDSGSTDATVSIAQGRWPFPVQVVQIQPEQFTFGCSLNCGLARARHALVVIASAHVYPVYPDWLERLLAPFADPEVALAYGKQRGDNLTHFSEQQIFAQWFPEASQSRQKHPFCNNANAAIRRSLWLEHPYDETLSGLEDLAWARWALEQGWALAYVAEAEIIHVHAERPAGIYYRYRREAMAFMHIFPQERFHFWDFLRLFASNAVHDAWQALRQRRLLASLGSITWFRFVQFWGTYQGFRQSGPLTWQLRQTFYYPRGLRSNQSIKLRDVEPIQYNDPA